MPEWLWAGIWGLIAGSALLIGAAIGDLMALGRRITAYVMAFGSGVLIAALSFDLMAGALSARRLRLDQCRVPWRRHRILHRQLARFQTWRQEP